MTASALEGVLVLEIASGISAAFAGKLLADLGAEVVMVEPPDGTPLRDHGLFDHLAGGKGSLVPAGDRDLRPWLDRADVIVTDGTSPWHAAVALGRPGRAVAVDVSPFGRSGPCAGWST